MQRWRRGQCLLEAIMSAVCSCRLSVTGKGGIAQREAGSLKDGCITTCSFAPARWHGLVSSPVRLLAKVRRLSGWSRCGIWLWSHSVRGRVPLDLQNIHIIARFTTNSYGIMLKYFNSLAVVSCSPLLLSGALGSSRGCLLALFI